MSRLFWLAFALFVIVSSAGVLQLRSKMSAARLGTDVVYILDEQGNAAVEVVDKTYFVDGDTAKNFDGLVARVGRPDHEPFRKGIEDSLKVLEERTGRSGMAVSDFEARFERQAAYGAKVYGFRWIGFAQKRDDRWVVDFRKANPTRMTKDSSLTVALPVGMSPLATEPSPVGGFAAGRLVWSGAGEMPWPYIEYR